MRSQAKASPVGSTVRIAHRPLAAPLLAIAALLLLFAAQAQGDTLVPEIPSLTQEGFGKACGTATDSKGDLYVADYETKKVKVFGPNGGGAITEFEASANVEGTCSIAVDSQGNVYVNGFFADVVKYKPSAFPPTSTTTYQPDDSIGGGTGTLVSSGASSVAVNPANDHVFVAEVFEGRVSEFDSAGSKVSGAIGEGLVPGALYWGVSVYKRTGNVYLTDPVNSKVYVLNPKGTQVLAEFDGSDSPDGPFEIGFSTFTQIAIDQANGDVLVPDITAHGVVDVFDEEGNYLAGISRTPALTDPVPAGVAVDNGSSSPHKGTAYVSSADGKVFAFGPLPTSVLLEVKKEGAGSGTVTSSPSGINCGSTCKARFAPGTQFTLSASADPGSRFKAWSGCDSTPAGKCKVTLGQEGASEVTAAFVPAVPSIGALASSQVSDTTARVEGTVNPDGDVTSYQFEYLTEAAYEANGNSFSGPQVPARAPASPVSIGSGFNDIPVSQLLSGLAPGTKYFFRILASSASGTTPSAPATLKTHVSQAPGLPDDRAYEQASPIDKNGGNLQAYAASTKASINGDAVTFESAAGIPGGEGAQEFATYLASRKLDPATGEVRWSTQGILPPATSGQGANVLGWTPDFDEVFDLAFKFGSGSEFLTRSSADGSLGTIANTSEAATNYSYAGVSADKGTVIFSAGDPLPLPPGSPTPAAESINLYTWNRASGEVRLAGILPDGTAPPNGSLAGLLGNTGYTQEQPAVMSDGSVYFTAGNQVYLRLNPTALETSQRDSDGDCIPTPGLACTIHISASEKTNGGGPSGSDASGTRPAQFMAASKSTSKAFFTSSEKLTDDATTGTEPALPAIARAKLGASGIEGSPEEGFLPAHASGITVENTHVYWADPTTGDIGRATLNGDGSASEVEPEFLSVGGSPRWVAVDSTYAYWTDPGENEENGEGIIGRAKLDKSQAPEPEFITGASQPQGVAVNGSNVYWANDGTAAIARAGINGSSPEPEWHPRGGFEAPQGLVLDGSHLYWTTTNSFSSFISLANLDGTGEKITFLGSNTIAVRGVAVDASHVYWVSQGENKIGRANLDLSGVEPSFITDTQKSKGLALDASHLYWSANGEVPPNPGNDLYRYDAEAPAGERLTDVTVDNHAADLCPGGIQCGADVQGVVGASSDGSHLYYVANGVPDGAITNSPNANGESAEPGNCEGPVAQMTGECNLYLWHEEGGQETTTFIARLDPSGAAEGDAMNWVQTLNGLGGNERFAQKTARVSSDGKTLLFRSQRQLTAYDNEGKPELYRFDPTDASTLCVSCSPTDVAPVGPVTLGTIRPPVGGASSPAPVLSRNLAAGGDRVFFETPDKLVAADTNGDASCEPWGSAFQEIAIRTCQDVYEWEANGTGSCRSEAQDGGCLYLLSTGKGTEPAFFSDASASGDDVFIFTADRLVGQDRDDLIDVYDARVGGGLAYQSQIPPVPCEGEACKAGASSQPSSQSAGTASFSGPGNASTTKPRKSCPKGKQRVRRAGKSRCVSPHKHKHRNAKTTGRASR